MNTTIFRATVVKIGDEAEELLAGRQAILFGEQFVESVPDLEPYCIVLRDATLTGDVVPGDTLFVDGISYPITAVGEVACKTLDDLAHCVLVFNGATEAELPGYINVSAADVPAFAAGTSLAITRG